LPENRPNPNPSLKRSVSEAVRQPCSVEDDRVILERVQAGDQQAMAEIFERHSRMAYSVALRVLHDPAQAEDVIQEVFFHVWKNPKAFAPDRGSLAAWLAVVTRNRAIDALRKRRPSDPLEEATIVSTTDIAGQVEQTAMLEQVRGAISKLPDDQRKSLELAFFGGMTHAEIAAQSGEPLGTIKTRIRTALISIRKAFGS
jgi:RNA polymerase sigma-70 factor (ECF subfamily)